VTQFWYREKKRKNVGQKGKQRKRNWEVYAKLRPKAFKKKLAGARSKPKTGGRSKMRGSSCGKKKWTLSKFIKKKNKKKRKGP